MKVSVGLVVVGVAAGVIWYLRRPSETAHADAPSAASDRHVSQLGSKPLEHVQKLANAEERRAFADRIAQAQASRAHADGRAAIRATPAPSLPATPPPTLDLANLDETKTTIRGAMREVIPLLGDCYMQAVPTLQGNETKVVAKLTLSSDPDVGTLIDAHEVLDDAGKPLPAKFDDCLRDTMQNLALPPIENGGTLEVHYPFVFRH